MDHQNTAAAAAKKKKKKWPESNNIDSYANDTIDSTGHIRILWIDG